MSDVTIPPPPRPDDRQILAGIGDRYVVFGSGATLRAAPRFKPDDVRRRLPRLDDERDGIEERIARSLVVEGYEAHLADGSGFGDVELVDGAGRTTLVEIKTGDRSFAGLDLGSAWRELGRAEGRREIWGFDLERLSVGVVWTDGGTPPQMAELLPLDVWSFNEDGSVFGRHDVVDELDDWSRRVEALYAEVSGWAAEHGLTAIRDRTIPMSEDLMQRFAVPDRDMPILDLLDGETPVVTLKPSGLWLIGHDGLIDVITRHGTFRLSGVPLIRDPSAWTLIDFRDRSRRAWGRDAFDLVLGRVAAGE